MNHVDPSSQVEAGSKGWYDLRSPVKHQSQMINVAYTLETQAEVDPVLTQLKTAEKPHHHANKFPSRTEDSEPKAPTGGSFLPWYKAHYPVE